VFSRVDGTLSEADLGVCTGLDALVVSVVLERLVSLGALRFEGGAPARPASQTQARSGGPMGTRPSGSALTDSPGARRSSDVVARSPAASARPSPTPVRPGPPPPSHAPLPQRGLTASHAPPLERGLTPAPPPRTSAAPASGSWPAARVTPVPSTYNPPSARPGDLHQLRRYLEAARLALAEGNSAGATNFYRLAHELAPGDPTIRAAIEGAVAATGEAREIGERAAVFVRRADAAARERRWEDAARDYQEAALLVPRDGVVIYKVAGALYRSDAIRPAAEFAQRAVALAPARVDSWLLLAQIHLAAGAIPPARQALAQAEKLSPGDERLARLRAKMPG
jgi:hypothetical protein